MILKFVIVTYLTHCKTIKPQRPELTCFIYDLGIYTFRKYMAAKIPGMVQGYLGHGEDHSAGDSERIKKERKTEEEKGS